MQFSNRKSKKKLLFKKISSKPNLKNPQKKSIEKKKEITSIIKNLKKSNTSINKIINNIVKTKQKEKSKSVLIPMKRKSQINLHKLFENPNTIKEENSEIQKLSKKEILENLKNLEKEIKKKNFEIINLKEKKNEQDLNFSNLKKQNLLFENKIKFLEKENENLKLPNEINSELTTSEITNMEFLLEEQNLVKNIEMEKLEEKNFILKNNFDDLNGKFFESKKMENSFNNFFLKFGKSFGDLFLKIGKDKKFEKFEEFFEGVEELEKFYDNSKNNKKDKQNFIIFKNIKKDNNFKIEKTNLFKNLKNKQNCNYITEKVLNFQNKKKIKKNNFQNNFFFILKKSKQKKRLKKNLRLNNLIKTETHIKNFASLTEESFLATNQTTILESDSQTPLNFEMEINSGKKNEKDEKNKNNKKKTKKEIEERKYFIDKKLFFSEIIKIGKRIENVEKFLQKKSKNKKNNF